MYADAPGGQRPEVGIRCLHSVETGPAMTSGRVASVYHHIHFYIWVLGSELSPHACSVNTVCTLAGLEFSSFHILGSLVLGCHM